MTSNITEVQNLLGELAKKIAITGAELTPSQVGRSLAGLKGLSSEVSIFAEISPLAGVYGDTDEAQFLLSALWDKIKVVKGQMPLKSIAQVCSSYTPPNYIKFCRFILPYEYSMH